MRKIVCIAVVSLTMLFLLAGLTGCAVDEAAITSDAPDGSDAPVSAPPSEPSETPTATDSVNPTEPSSPAPESGMVLRPNSAPRFSMDDLTLGAYSYGSERRLIEVDFGQPVQEDNVVWDATGEAHDTLYYDGVTFDFVWNDGGNKASAKLREVIVTSPDFAGPRGICVGQSGQAALDAFAVEEPFVSEYGDTVLYYAKTLDVSREDGSDFTVYLAPSGHWEKEDDRITLSYRVPEFPYASEEEEEAYPFVSHGNLNISIGPDGLVESFLWWVGTDAE